jgi:hypothetical protein
LILEFTASEVLTHPAGAPSPARIAARRRTLLTEDLCNNQVYLQYTNGGDNLNGSKGFLPISLYKDFM